jgi:hypothetical protein
MTWFPDVGFCYRLQDPHGNRKAAWSEITQSRLRAGLVNAFDAVRAARPNIGQ